MTVRNMKFTAFLNSSPNLGKLSKQDFYWLACDPFGLVTRSQELYYFFHIILARSLKDGNFSQFFMPFLALDEREAVKLVINLQWPYINQGKWQTINCQFPCINTMNYNLKCNDMDITHEASLYGIMSALQTLRFS